jgi:hypothetical protein
MLNGGLRSLPYLVHTNRELGLMLKGAKPLSKFCNREDDYPEAMKRYLRLFDRHVSRDRLIRQDRLVPTSGGWRLHNIYFTLPGEEWRVEAMIELFARPGRWNAEREREEGRLLGYTEWENDVWAERFPFRPA